MRHLLFAALATEVSASPAAARDVQNWSTLSLTAKLGGGRCIHGDISGRTAARERDEQVRLILPVRRGDIAADGEPFIALRRTSDAPRTFEQLRFTGSVLVPLTDVATLDVGYLNQHLYRADGHLENHVAPVTLRLSF